MTDQTISAFRSRPQTLILKIELPKIDSAADVELDISEKTLLLDVGEEPNVLYHLEVGPHIYHLES